MPSHRFSYIDTGIRIVLIHGVRIERVDCIPVIVAGIIAADIQLVAHAIPDLYYKQYYKQKQPHIACRIPDHPESSFIFPGSDQIYHAQRKHKHKLAECCVKKHMKRHTARLSQNIHNGEKSEKNRHAEKPQKTQVFLPLHKAADARPQYPEYAT